MEEAASVWSPLRSRIFFAVWTASIASNIGTWIQSIGEKWQMAHLSSSPLLIALIETGTTLPVLFLGLAAGAFADILDRRRLLIATQLFMLVVASALAILTFANLISPALLLAMSLLIGIGSALSMPAFQAIIPELLPRRELTAGVTLNSAGFNLSRAIGPAIGGAVVGWFGAGWAFAMNAASFLAVVAVLVRWNRKELHSGGLPTERFLGALRVGFRYARHSKEFTVILLRTVGYVWFSGVIFSLLPALALHDLRLSSERFGLLMGCVGAGAVAAMFLMPRFRDRFTANQLLAFFTLLDVAAQAVIAFIPHAGVVAVCLFVAGTTWMAVLTTLNTAIQLSVPAWVKARAFGAYQMVWGGSMALGAAFWGIVAQHFGIRLAFAASAAGMLVTLALIGRMHLTAFDEELDLSPHSEGAHPPSTLPMDAGPLLVVSNYEIAKEDRDAFLEAMREVRALRMRDGALRWSLYEDSEPAENGHLRFIESFLSESMGEHLRQHHRATAADRAVLGRAYRLDPAGRPRTRHLIAVGDQNEGVLQRMFA